MRALTVEHRLEGALDAVLRIVHVLAELFEDDAALLLELRLRQGAVQQHVRLDVEGRGEMLRGRHDHIVGVLLLRRGVVVGADAVGLGVELLLRAPRAAVEEDVFQEVAAAGVAVLLARRTGADEDVARHHAAARMRQEEEAHAILEGDLLARAARGPDVRGSGGPLWQSEEQWQSEERGHSQAQSPPPAEHDSLAHGQTAWNAWGVCSRRPRQSASWRWPAQSPAVPGAMLRELDGGEMGCPAAGRGETPPRGEPRSFTIVRRAPH